MMPGMMFQTNLFNNYNSLRHINADEALNHNDSLCPDHRITSIVGHSLGGSVVLDMQEQYLGIKFETRPYGAPVASMTTPAKISTNRFRNYDDPISMLDRGSTMSVKNPGAIQTYLNIKNLMNMVDVVTKALDNHGYTTCANHKLDTTTQDTFAYTAEE